MSWLRNRRFRIYLGNYTFPTYEDDDEFTWKNVKLPLWKKVVLLATLMLALILLVNREIQWLVFLLISLVPFHSLLVYVAQLLGMRRVTQLDVTPASFASDVPR